MEFVSREILIKQLCTSFAEKYIELFDIFTFDSEFSGNLQISIGLGILRQFQINIGLKILQYIKKSIGKHYDIFHES